MNARSIRGLLGITIALVIAWLLLSWPMTTPTRAAPSGLAFIVNSTLDEPASDASGNCISTPSAKCTLRAAIMAANFSTGPHTITVPSGVYLLTRPGYDDDAFVGDLDIRGDLTIQGAGSSLTIVDGNGSLTQDRVFQIFTSVQAATLRGMTIRNGQSLSSTIGVIGGGGLYIDGAAHVVLSDVIIDGNTGQNGGGIYANFSALGGSLELDHVSLHANRAIAGGVGEGGGVFAYMPASSPGGAVIQDSQVYSNTADGTGGGFLVEGNNSGQWIIQRSQLYSNTAASGGAISNFVPLALSDSSLHDNHASFDGGAIEAESPYAILRSTLNANSAGRFGGGIFDLQTSSATSKDFARIEQSTFNGNYAQYGGGIYHDGYITPGSLLTLLNSTLSGNGVYRPGGATGSAEGGGIYIYGGKAQLLNTTVANNRAQVGRFPNFYAGIGGGLYITASATFTAENSLIANNAHGNGLTLDTPDDCFSTGTVGTLAYDLFTTTANCFVTGTQGGNIVGQDPLLGPLQYNGGSTPTRALSPGSPAIDNGAPAGCIDDLGNPLVVDQRGFERPSPAGGACDIGAYEKNQKTDQRITFSPIPDRSVFEFPFSVSATASSGLAVTYTASGACDVSGSTVTPSTVGSCTITAHQPGDSNYNPASDVTQAFMVVAGKVFLPAIFR